MKTTAAVLVTPGKPLELADLEIPELGPGQALVEIAHSGVCHTQLLEARGRRGKDPWCPHCLGHEAVGTVVEAGSAVTKVSPGDKVVAGWIKGAGVEAGGSVYRWDGEAVNAGGVTTLSRHAVISENRLVRLPTGTDERAAVLLGCAAPTGMGAVLNVCKPEPGQSLIVFGLGGVGICAVAAAKAAGCDPVVGVDPIVWKRELAQGFGATHTPEPGETLSGVIGGIAPGGFDFAVEATGIPSVMAAALAAVRPQGGAAVVIGNAPAGDDLTLDPREFNQGKRLLGTWGGDSDPDRDVPRFAELISSAAFDAGKLLSGPYNLEAVNAAFDDLEAGTAGRPIVSMGEGA